VEKLQTCLDDLVEATRRFDCQRAREILLVGIGGYQPNNGIDDLVWQAQHGAQGGDPAAASKAVVTHLDSRRPTSSA